MTTSRTTTGTITQARYVAAKIAADLKRVQRLVGRGVPTDGDIAKYEEEATILLRYGYLGAVTYGFMRNEKWVFAVQYTASDSALLADHDPGLVFPPVNVDNAVFFSFLSYSDKWQQLSLEQQQECEEKLPFKRVPGDSPGGGWVNDSSYRSGSIQVRRHSLER